MMKDFDLFEYKNLTFKMYLDVESNPGQTYWDGWTVDLIKLYFSASFRESIKNSYKIELSFFYQFGNEFMDF